jgi:hypothetical protein
MRFELPERFFPWPGEVDALLAAVGRIDGVCGGSRGDRCVGETLDRLACIAPRPRTVRNGWLAHRDVEQHAPRDAALTERRIGHIAVLEQRGLCVEDRARVGRATRPCPRLTGISR